MGYIHYNPNPQNKRVGDCVVRAISAALDISWEQAYVEIALQGFIMSNMPTANSVWGAYLVNKGFEEHLLPRSCDGCYTLIDFCEQHPHGIYVVGTDDHAVCCINGSYWDSFDSGDVIPTYYFKKNL